MNKKINILIIGSGLIASKHKKILEKNKKINHITTIKSRSFTSNSFQNKKKFNLALICSPSSMHLKHIDLLVKNSINFFVEKPLSCRNFNFKKLIKKIDIKNIKTTEVGYVFRHDQNAIWIKKQLEKKSFGKILYSQIICKTNFLKWREKNYIKTVSAHKKLGGGVLNELSHELDYALWFFGNLKIKSAQNYSRNKLRLNVEDLSIIHAENQKIKLNIILDMLSFSNERKLYIFSEKKTIIWDLLKDNIKIIEINKKIIKINKIKNDKFYLQMDSLIKNHFDKRTTVNLKDGYNVVNLINKIKLVSNKIKKI